MKVNIAKELAALERMTVGELHDRYAEVFGEQARSRHKHYLIRRIAWRISAARSRNDGRSRNRFSSLSDTPIAEKTWQAFLHESRMPSQIEPRGNLIPRDSRAARAP